MLKYLFILLVFAPYSLLCQLEICDNAIDDDQDGLIDLNDEDCSCTIIQPTSLIPNPSFEDLDCCPSDRSALYCASGWIQASEPTTDFIHECGWLGWEQFPPPRPFPDGEGIMGFRDGRVRGNGNNEPEPFWKEYAGACLLNPLIAGTTYRFQFDVGFVDPQSSPPITITFFGSSDCANLPFGIGDDNFGCPTNDLSWVKLGEVYVFNGSGGGWVSSHIEVTPDMDIHTIAIGPECQPLPNSNNTYYFFDNLLLDNLESFNFQISENGHTCSPDFVLSVHSNPGVAYQWYLSGIALVGEVSHALSQNYGPGDYQVRIIDDTGCRVTPSYNYTIPVYNEYLKVEICEGEAYSLNGIPLEESGAYYDTLSTQNGCDSIILIDLDILGVSFDTTKVTLFEGDEFKINNVSYTRTGEYPITLTSEAGCDSLVLLQVETFSVYMPNAFSPNDDGINDVFQPLVAAGLVSSYGMQVYDRWGELVYDGPSWDGARYQAGVYIYLVQLNLPSGEAKLIHGAVSLLR